MATEMAAPASQNAAAQDAAARTRALESPGSVLVRAPAGSGKTELLVQRFLRLLATVNAPEALAAVTFTRKAAGEMRDRLLRALAAAAEPAPQAAHARLTWELARAAAARDAARGWDLLRTPARLRITTLDALALSIASQIPWQSGFGAPPAPSEDCDELYRIAARATLERLERGEAGAAAVHGLLRRLLGDSARAEQQLAGMLAKRDQWLPIAAQLDRAGLRAVLEANFAAVAGEELAPAIAWLRAQGLAVPANAEDWRETADAWLTKAGTVRKRPKPPGPEPPPEVCAALHAARSLPHGGFSEAAWQALAEVLEVARLAVAELQWVFATRGACDFTEVAIRAAAALDGDGAASGLAQRLDARLEHLFVDEFQDTSQAQFGLLERLVADWAPDDGRTLFLVGDAMQSIYGFRNAQVELFQRTAAEGRLGPVAIEVLDLRHNFRSQDIIVGFNNHQFASAAAAHGLTDFHVEAAAAAAPAANAEVQVHAVQSASPAAEARRVADLVEAERGPGVRLALLAHSRSHLDAILPELERRGVRYRGVNLLAVGDAPAVRDLLALTRALHLAADRLSWLAVLRAPWCGLRLASLHALCGDDRDAPLLELLRDPNRRARLEPEERARLEAVLPTLEAAAREHGRTPLPALVEWTWRRLGGEALAGADAPAARAFFDLLRERDERGGSEDFAGLADAAARLRQPPGPEAGDAVEVMTAHGAKGLEYDVVIAAGLSRRLRGSVGELLRFEGVHGLAAAAPAAGEKDPHFAYAGQRLQRRVLGERLRLLYVAATRAKRRLHLVAGSPVRNPKTGAMRMPHANTLLARLWPGLEPEFERQYAAETESEGEGAAAAAAAAQPVDPVGFDPPPLRRVRTIAPAAAVEGRAPGAGAPVQLGGDELARRVGTAVHALLQEMAESGRLAWNRARLRQRLRMEGIAPRELAAAEARAARALDLTLADPRGRWILSRHEDDHCEWALSGLDAGTLTDRQLDRSFVDQGVRWIVDFKTAQPRPGEAVAAFRERQAGLYGPQLAAYARLISGLGEGLPVRCGLYFPLLEGGEGWLELTPS